MKRSTFSSSFGWLNVTQFLGALNDNVFKLLVIFFLVEIGQDRETIVTTASIIFVLPFLLFSHAAGVLADRFSKRTIIVGAKIMEAAIMALGCGAILLANEFALFGLIFLMCAQSAIFGPSKYGIIPELVPSDKLSKANSYLVSLSYLAIIIGTFIPSYFLVKLFANNFLGLAVFCVAVAGIGIVASLQIEKTPAAGGQKPFTPLFVIEIFKTIREISRNRYLILTVLGLAYFLYIAALIQQNVLFYGAECLRLGFKESGFLFPVAALGIGVGAILTGRLSGQNIEFGLVPIGVIGLTVCCILLAVITPSVAVVLVIMFALGVSAGFFIVPLNAFVQYESPRKQLGEILACMNFLSFFGVALSAGTLILLIKVFGLDPRACFLVGGVLTAVLAVAAVIVLPDFLIRFVVVVFTRLIYRIKIGGAEHIPAKGPALLVSNHVTWVDALLLSAITTRRIRFLMAREIYENSWMKPLFKLMQVIPVSPTDPPRQIVRALKTARNALEDGCLVCIFAEGAITRNGNLRAFRPGVERIVRGTSHPIVPVSIGNAWGSIFSYYSGRLLSSWPKAIPYDVSIHLGQAMPATSSTAEVRRAVLELSALAFDVKKTKTRTLPRCFVRTARKHWFRTAIADTTGKRLTFGHTLTASIALSGVFREILGDQKMVGILMPTSVGGALANTAVSMLGRIPVNLNFTASTQALQAALRRCEIETIISSRAFLDKLKTFEPPDGIVFMEDLAPKVTAGKKALAFLKALLLPSRFLLPAEHAGPDDLATVIFSSGSTGEPKGVMLSHHNLISNIEAFCMVFRLGIKENMCATLPFFHSFGYTTTLWGGLISGYASHYHTNPLDGAKIAEMARENKLTHMLSTPTFLLAYIRKAKREDFATLKAVVTGAEKLKPRVADSFEKRFGLRPLEGYGATELSPVTSLNIPDVEVDDVSQTGTKEGSIGHPIPGVTAMIVDPETGAILPNGKEGLLKIKGPNVMQGYLKDPEKTREVLRDGWYDTGDIGRMDDDGFIFLLDRMSRYSKIGGEMAPHMAIEEKLTEALGAVGMVVFVSAAPDEKKGEQLVVFYTDEAGDANTLHDVIKASDLPNLWKPKKENLFRIDAIPTLGSGKVDLKKMKTMARDLVENRPGFIEKTVEKIREAL